MKKYLEQILVAEILLFSGGIVFFQIYLKLIMVIFVMTSFIYYYIYGKRSSSISNNLIILLSLVVWIFLVQFVFVDERSSNSDLTYILFPTGVCFILSSMSFYRFRTILLRLLTLLSIVSIIVQIGYLL